MQVGQPLEELIDNDLLLQARDLPHWIAFDPLVQSLLIVPHRDVEELILTLASHISAESLTNEVIAKHSHYLDLPVAIS